MTSVCRLFVAYLFSMGMLWAQSASDLEDLLLRCQEARADTSIYLNTRSISLKGVIMQDGISHDFELDQRYNGKIRLKVYEAEDTVIQIDDGAEAWRWIAGKPEVGVLHLTPEQRRFFRLSQSFYSPLERPEDFGFKVRYLGMESNNESPEHHVRLASDQFEDVVDIWIDANTFLETRRIYRPNEEAQGLETVYSDYEPMEGLMTPRTVETRFQGNTLTRTKIESIKRNPGMLSFFFNKPSNYEIISEASAN